MFQQLTSEIAARALKDSGVYFERMRADGGVLVAQRVVGEGPEASDVRICRVLSGNAG